jgi:hypothetical protein
LRKPNQISQEQLLLADFSVRAELDFLTASSQQLIKMYLRRKEAEEEDEEEEERTEDGGHSCLQISYKLGYIQVYSNYQRPESTKNRFFPARCWACRCNVVNTSLLLCQHRQGFSAVLQIRNVYPGFRFLSIPDVGSRIPDPATAPKEKGEKLLSYLFM